MKKGNIFTNIGPGTLVAAAFIGPGTVTVCSITGDTYGFTLLWALTLSIISTIVLQGMSARLGLISQLGLAEAVKDSLTNKWLKWLGIGLIISAVLIGNSAYEAGNISGGVLGINSIINETQISIGALNFNYVILLLGLLAGIILFIGNYKVLERVLVLLVLLMSLAFITAAILTKPDFSLVLKGMFLPKAEQGSLLTIISLVGTTVVPYNLFLHASLVKEKWSDAKDLKHVNRDTIISIVLGGVVSMAIVVCAAAVQSGQMNNGADLAQGLVPLFGESAKYFLGFGLFAAGLTSSITAPMAAAYAAKGCFGWEGNLKSKEFRAVWLIILLIGIIVSLSNYKPIEIIQFAQIANGLLLPIIAIFLWWIVNQTKIMGVYVNSLPQNIITGLIILLTLILCIKTLLMVFNFL